MVRLQRHIVVGIVMLLLAALSASSVAAKPKHDEYVLPGDAVFPEGVVFQQSTGYFFVSSTTNGTIFRGHVNDPVAEIFLPGGEDGRTTAIGLALDDAGRLYVAGGGTGRGFVYDTATGDLLAALQLTTPATEPGGGPTFVNDVVVTRSGDAFFTDSMNPVLYRVYQQPDGTFAAEDWLDFTGTALEYQSGFNVNGIVVTQNDKYLVVVQSNTGKLFRIDIATQEVIEIEVDAVLNAGDGLVLHGRTLYVVRNSEGEIAVVKLSGQLDRGVVTGAITDPSFRFPTTADMARGSLLVVNAQFDRRMSGDPDLPFTVSSVKPKP